jgi:hypothetical protein
VGAIHPVLRRLLRLMHGARCGKVVCVPRLGFGQVRILPCLGLKRARQAPTFGNEVVPQDTKQLLLKGQRAGVWYRDPSYVRSMSLSQRAGLTVLCRTPRRTGCGKDAPQGCNGWKGQIYDRLFKGMLAGQQIRPHKLKFRHSVAVLTMAYLAAFQRFGYGCVLDDAFDTVRIQADYPNRRVTPWVDTARINLRQHELNGTVWATSSGLPFIFGWHGVRGSALEVQFRRFLVLLPGGHWLVHHDPGLLLPAIIEPPADPSPNANGE